MAKAKTNILVIEDEEDIRELVKYNLHRENFGVLEASSGEDGLKLMERSTPDPILLDLMLPGSGHGQRRGYALRRHLLRENRSEVSV